MKKLITFVHKIVYNYYITNQTELFSFQRNTGAQGYPERRAAYEQKNYSESTGILPCHVQNCCIRRRCG